MLCQECKKKKAVYFYSENVNGKSYSVALCEDCKKRIANNGTDIGGAFSYGILDGLLFPSSLGFHTESREKRCNKCNSSFFELAKGKREFCPECYSVFHSELSQLLLNIHGADRHIGKRPGNVDNKNDSFEKAKVSSPKEDIFIGEIEKLKNELSKAIKDERYEDAAAIRDEIKRKEEEQK